MKCSVCGCERVRVIGLYSLYPHATGVYLREPSSVQCMNCTHKWDPTMEDLDEITPLLEEIESRTYKK